MTTPAAPDDQSTSVTSHFQAGQAAASNGVAAPNGTSVAPTPVRPISVLQPVSSSGTGLASGDRQRALQGQGSINGSSASTAQAATQRKYPFTQI